MATKKVTKISADQTPHNFVKDNSFPIVGMGASAGGLEAFEQFFRHVPPDCGMAFVLVQHLDPNHNSILSEILQRTAAIPALEAKDQMEVEPDHIYVIPPNRDMTIFNGKLQICMPNEPRSQRLPIDTLMRSLAEERGESAIGIVLSGTGTDGTLGLRAILGAGGISLVQAPETAKFNGMPNSAIQAGYATQVLLAEEMPDALMGDLHHLIVQHSVPSPLNLSGIARILMMLRGSSGHDFSQYKKTTITRRIERRMSIHNIENAEVYVRYLKEHPVEVQLLFKELLINVTSFFRDPEVFIELKINVLPELLADKPDDYVFRVWVAGCATGEEAYSIAILLRELMDESHKEFRTQIYATDLDDDAIAAARAGLYLPNIVQDVSPERLRRFFVKDDAGFRVKKEIREMVVFAVQNVIKDPPFTKLDLLSCRNLMIYLEPVLQNKLIPAFHYSLKARGVLLVSPSESIGNHTDLFEPISRKWKLYRSMHTTVSSRKLLQSGLTWAVHGINKIPEIMGKKTREANFSELAKRMLLQLYAPASVMTDLHGNILFVHGETGRYLRPAPGHATLNVIEMAREGLQLELRTAIYAAVNEGTPTINKELSVKTNGDFSIISFSLRRQVNPDARDGILLLSFQDVATVVPSKSKRRLRTESSAQLRIDALEQELVSTKETLQATIEAQQVSNEEMLSSNEEMQSTNEEMQSTNEELETSKEELQSVNEELITVNAELQSKIEQLSDMQNDMKNLLDNVNVGIIFLDQHMHIRRFTREATRVYRLAESDVGRHLGDIKSDLDGDDLLVPAQSVLDSLVPYEREMRTTNGKWCLAHIQPYRSLENVIDGVVLTFTDITERIDAIAMREALEMANGIVDTVREPLVVLDNTLQVVSVSHSFYQTFKVIPNEVIHRPIYELGNQQWDIPLLRKLLDSVLNNGDVFDNYLVEHDFPEIGHRKMLLNARRIAGKVGKTQFILLAIEEIK
jgi:two-component system CheB/CheR fusion protein